MTPNHTRKINKKFKGFTLLEVLVSATILAFASFGLFAVFSLAEDLHQQSESSFSSSQIFSSRLALLSSLPYSFYNSLYKNNPKQTTDFGNCVVYELGTESPPNETWPFNFSNSQPEIPTQPLYLIFNTTKSEGKIPYSETVEIKKTTENLSNKTSTPVNVTQIKIRYNLSYTLFDRTRNSFVKKTQSTTLSKYDLSEI